MAMKKHAGYIHRQKLLSICQDLETRYGSCVDYPSTDFVGALILQVLEVGVDCDAVIAAYARVLDEYVDWHDLRVAEAWDITDILGADFPKAREKADYLHDILTSVWSLSRKMNLDAMVQTEEGVNELRGLAASTMLREDFIDGALLTVCGWRIFPCTVPQYRQLMYLGGARGLSFKNGCLMVARELDTLELRRLSRGLREHVERLDLLGISKPMPINYDARGKEKGPGTKTVVPSPVVLPPDADVVVSHGGPSPIPIGYPVTSPGSPISMSLQAL